MKGHRPRLLGAGVLLLWLLTGWSLPLVAQPANDNFANAIEIFGSPGSVSGSNAGATAEPGEPPHGAPSGASVWFVWTAPKDGTAYFHTQGSLFDTTIAAYTGDDVANLVQVGANDDNFFDQLFLLSSLMTFPVVQDEVYHIAVDGFVGQMGDFSLTWGVAGESGIFDFANTLYTFTDFESFADNPKDAPGGLVTVNRIGGSRGRVLVDYYITNILVTNLVTTNIVTTNGMGQVMTNSMELEDIFPSAVPGLDYSPVRGTLIFDDFQTSTNIVVPVSQGGDPLNNLAPFLFVGLTNPRPAPQENVLLVEPVTGFTNITRVNLIDLLHPFFNPPVPPANVGTYSILRRYYRNEESDRNIAITVVNPNGLPGQVTLSTLDNFNFPPLRPYGYPLADSSDYSDDLDGFRPNPPYTDGSLDITNRADFSTFTTQLTFPPDIIAITINFPLPVDDGVVEFNEDIRLVLTDPDINHGIINGFCNVAILYDDQPAGAADRTWNPANNSTTIPPFNLKPGANSEVFDVAIQADQKAVIVGDFTAYNTVPRNRIARVNVNGSLDTSFNPRTGADGFVSAVDVYPPVAAIPANNNKILIGGAFASIDNVSRNRIARLNPDGSLDTTFQVGNGFNGVVRDVVILPSGKILVGGEFTLYNGVERRNIARLNADGSLDSSFNPGLGPNAVVWDVATDDVSQSLNLLAATTSPGPAVFATNVTTIATAGTVTVDFSPGCTPDRLTVYNGPNLLFDSGYVDEYNGDPACAPANFVGPLNYVIPYGPGPDADITIMVNEGGTDTDVEWGFSAVINATGSGERVYLGGEFTAINGIPRNGIARLSANGNVDMSFNPGDGVDGPVYALALQNDLKVILGGRFETVDFRPRRSLARLEPNGGLDLSYEPGEGANNSIYTIRLQDDGKAIIGGLFTEYDMVRRVGMARLFTNGVLDTSFMDTAYNQFAGLINPFSFEPDNFVNSLAIQADGNVLIGGSFTNLGGHASGPAPIWTRQDQVPRFNLARILGGYTPGPGNVSLFYDEYTADENGVVLSITLQRFDGRLGTLQASLFTEERFALADVDYRNITNLLVWPEFAYPVSPRSVGFVGPFYASLPLIDDEDIEGDELLTAIVRDSIGSIFLGGELVPLMGARGRFSSPVTISDNDFDYGVIAFRDIEYVVNENGLQASINVIRTNGIVGAVTVDYYTYNGTALAGSDYTTASGTLTFAPGEVEKTFPVTILNDVEVEPDETIFLVLTNAGGGALLPEGLTNSAEVVPLTIIDDDFALGHLNLSSTNYLTVENAGFASVIVTRTGGNVGRVTNLFSTVNGSALAGTDYVQTITPLVWDNGDSSDRIVQIPLINNELVDGPREFQVMLSNPSFVGILGPRTLATVRIEDDDAFGEFAFSQPVYEGDENGGTAAITVIRLNGVAETVQVSYTATAGSALPGTDFSPVNGVLTFEPGVTAQSFLVPLLDDTPEEMDGEKTVVLTLTSVDNGSLGNPSTAQLTIIDDESFNIPAGSLDTTFNALAGPNGDVFDIVRQEDGRLIIAGNFTRLNGITKSRIGRLFPDGSVEPAYSIGFGPDAPVRTLALQPNNKVILGGFFTTVHGTNRNHIARLNEDGTLDTFFNPGAGADNPIFDLKLLPDGRILIGGSFTSFNGISRPGVAILNTNGTLHTLFDPGVGANGAVQAVDFQRDGKVLIAGDFSAVGNVPRNRVARLLPDGSLDLSFDPGEGVDDTVRTLLVQPDGRILLGGSFAHVNGTPRAFLARLMPDGSVDDEFLDGVAGGNGVVLDLTLQLDSKIIVVGDFTQFNDVTRNRITRLYPDGSTDPTINFGAGTDAFIAAALVQPDRRIVIGGGFSFYNRLPRTRIARIHGGSIDGPGSAEFEFPIFSVLESQSEAVITVRRVGGTTGSASVMFDTFDAGALAGQDYVATNGLIVFPEGEVLRRFTIAVLDDVLIEPDEQVILALSTNATSGMTLGPQPISVLSILSDDSTIGFLTATFSVNENAVAGYAQIEVVRTGTTNTTVTVDYYTLDETAVAGQDYQPAMGTLTFGPGEQLKLFTVPIIDDDLVEGIETVALYLTNATQGAGLILSQSVLQIIDDNFDTGQFNFSMAAYGVNEYETNKVITVLRQSGSSGVVKVDYATQDGTANVGLDYLPAGGSLTFADGETIKTFNVPIIPDYLDETNETVILTLSTPTGGAILGPTSTAILTITNNALVNGTFSLSQAQYTRNESNLTATITVNRSLGSLGPVSVGFRTINGTALAGQDFTPTNGTLNWMDGDATPKTFVVNLVNDSVVEQTETLTIRIENPTGGATLGQIQQATLTILDDDQAPGTLGFLTAAYFVDEDATNAQVTVTRTFGSTGTVTIDYATLAIGTAVPGNDYLPTNGTLTFLDGQASQTFLVRVFDNQVVTSSRNLGLMLSNPTGGATTNGAILLADLTIRENESQAGSVDTTFSMLGADAAVNVLFHRTNDNKVMVGGDFTTLEGQPRARIARLNSNGTIDTSFDSGSLLNAPVLDVAQTAGGRAVVGGAFTGVGSASLDYLCLLNQDGTLDTNFVARLDNQVNAVAVRADGNIIAAGNFTSVNGTNRSHLAVLRPNGTLDPNFNPVAAANGPVRAVAIDLDGSILIAGDFSIVNGQPRIRIARLTSSGQLDATFTPGLGADASIRELTLLPTDRIMIGGMFNNYDGQVRPHIARLLPNGRVDTTFNPALGPNEFISVIRPQTDGKLLVGGGFTTFNGFPYSRLVRLHPDGAVDTSFNTGSGANSFVSALAIQPDRKIIVGGGFTEFDGIPQNFLTRLHGGVNIGSGSITLVTNAYTVVESAGELLFEVRRRIGASNAVSVAFATSNGTALAGQHYVATNGVLNFAPGQTLAYFVLQVIDDSITNVDRVLNVTLSNPLGGATLGIPSSATVTLLNDDDVVGFAIDAYSVSESAGQAFVTLSRRGGGVGTVSVNFATGAGSATAGTDYQNVSGVVTFLPGQFQTTFTVPIFDDVTPEGLETINLTLGGVTGTAMLGLANASLTIVDDDFSPGAIGFTAANYAASEQGTNAVITLARTGGSSGSASVQFRTSPATATAGLDYGPVNVTVSFADGETAKTVLVQVFDDALVEGAEILNLTLSNPVGGALGLATSVLTILGDEALLSFSTNDFVVVEGVTNAVVQVVRANGGTGPVSVDYLTMAGNALDTLDFTNVTGTLTFNPGVTNQFFLVPIVDDLIGEDPEFFLAGLVNPVGEAILAQPSGTAITILDNDTSFRFGQPNYLVSEALGPAAISIVRVGVTNGPASVRFATSDGTAIAGMDYTFTSLIIDFADGEVMKTVQVPILDDLLGEGNETVNLNLFNPVTGNPFDLGGSAVLTIVDNEDSLSFSQAVFEVDETASNAVITVLRQGTPQGPITVDYRTRPGTATPGLDYTSSSGTLFFTAFETSKTFSVPILDDAIAEGDETLQLILTNASPGVTLVSPTNSTLVIHDDDVSLRFSASSFAADESASNAVVTVERIGASATFVSVGYLTGDGTATAGVDYQSVSNLLAFPPGVTNRSFLVPIFDDLRIEGDETVLLGLVLPTNIVGNVVLGNPSNAVLNILDNDTSTIVPSGASLVSESFVPNNGLIDPGERVTIAFGLRNVGNVDTVNLEATLQVTNGVTQPVPVVSSYGAVIAGGATVSRSVSFVAGGTSGDVITATFRLMNFAPDQTNDLGVVAFAFSLGQATRGFTNSAGITINDASAATPYPSVITVSDVLGDLARLTVRLNNLSHAFPDDLDILLEGPNGNTVMLMSDAGGGFFNALNNVNLTFDDAADVAIPDSSVITSGTYRPGNYSAANDPMPAPAPAAPFGTALSAFTGINPVGDWKLYVVDDGSGEIGNIAGGWSLTMVVADLIEPVADLSVQIDDAPDPILLGGTLTYTIGVTNHGPGNATGVVLTNQLPAGVAFLSATGAPCTEQNGLVTCTLGAIARGTGRAVQIAVLTQTPEVLTDSAGVAGIETDPNPDNNLASVKTTVSGSPELSIVLQGGNIILSWPAAASSFVLQAADDLDSLNWADLTVSPLQVGDQVVVTMPVGSTPAFYRLRAP